MRDPKQEARRIPMAFKDTDKGGKQVILYHERDGEVACPPGSYYGEAAQNAEAYINEHYPGRSL